MDKAAQIPGSACISTLIQAPLFIHKEGIRILPMHTIQRTKATAIVTTVPSDSPDDLAMLCELAKKPGFYGVERQWVELAMLSVIRTPAYGDLAAPALMESLKISSVRDRKELEMARELAYKEGYFHGVMNTGDFAGESVEAAKPKVIQLLLTMPNPKAWSSAGQATLVAWPLRTSGILITVKPLRKRRSWTI